MAFTIYTVSDPATVGSVLTSMAMFFGQDSWVGSAIKLALIVSLIVILAKGVTRDGMRLDIMLLQLLVVMGAFIPKTTVTVEQFDNAAPARVVDEVPYAIAIPGSIAGAFALYMTNKIELVMQGVQPNYVTVSGEIGPFTPARTMMWYAMCVTDVTRCMDQNLLQTMHAAARYCGTGSLSAIPFHQKSNVFKTFAEGLDTDGMTMIYTDTKPFNAGGGGGEAVGCADAASYLISLGDDLDSGNPRMFASTFNGIAKNSDIKRYNTAGGTPSSTDEWDDALAKINRVTSSGANINTLSMANMMTYSIAEQFARESKSSLDKTLAIKRDVGLFDWAKSEAEKSLLVTTTAPKFMDILFFIFIAATPIVMFVVAANPASGVKVAGSYVLFGLWTQSWIPMMAIIGGWYQAELHNYPGPQANLGMTPEYMAGMMRHVNTATIAAANMLQTAPYMMFAIMTGSMFAMSSMIAKAAPSAGAGASSEGGSAAAGGGKAGGMLGVPSPGGSAASAGLAQRQAVMAGATSLGGGGLGSDESFVGGGAAASFPGLPALQTGAAVKSGVAANSEVSAASRASLQKQQAAAMADMSSLIKSSSHKIDGGQVAQHMTNAGYQTSYDAKSGMLTSKGFAVDMKSGVIDATSAGTSTTGGANGTIPGLKELGVAIGGGFQYQRAGSTSMSNGVTDTKNLGSQGTQSVGSSASVNTGEQGSNGTSGSDRFEYAAAAQKAKSLTDTFSKIASESKSLDEADKLSKQAGSDSSISSGAKIDGAQIVDGWSAKTMGDQGRQSGTGHEAMERVSRALGGVLQGPDGASLKEAAIQAQRGMERSDSALGNTTNHDQRAAAAMLQALDDRTRTGASAQQRNEGFAGMTALARASGIQVSSSALSTLEASANQFKQAEERIGKMAQAVQPAVNGAADKVDASLAGSSAHKANVDNEMASNKASADSFNQAANRGAAGVAAAGNAAVAAEAMKAAPAAAPIPQAEAAALRSEALRNANDRPLIPMTDDLGGPMENSSTSVKALVKGAAGAGQEAARQSLDAANSVSSGAVSRIGAQSGTAEGSGSPDRLSAGGASAARAVESAVNGAGAAGSDAVRSTGSGLAGAVAEGSSAAQSVVNVVNAAAQPEGGGSSGAGQGGGGSASSLPTLGTTSGPNLAGGGGGGNGVVTQAPPEVTGKPNGKVPAAGTKTSSKGIGPR